ncbi:hypothetical protein [Streptomyces turgidiscabies]|uniref:Uncharacterized protein n=1 Tax=Streptomyces turgidiscabies TaxID=85558 RepID=A0ABU0REV2_9ACTN|nr:hypothetical protein [Streptomyces turgidiscabies]MDQ0930522.1 hypothetical protein [Streptomyces turgidiscabies]
MGNLMGMFRRGDRRDGTDLPRDAEFTFLSEAEGARLRALVRAAFAARGIEVTAEPGHVITHLGWRLGLSNIAAVCHNDSRGPRRWQALVDEHVDRCVRSLAGPQALKALPREELLARLHPRFIPGEPRLLKAFGYGPPSVPGLLEVLALDLPQTVDMLTEDSLAELGELTSLRDRAFQNLRAVRVDKHRVVRDKNGSRFDVLTGGSYFVAGLALVLDEVVRRYVKDAPAAPHGLLVALPHRHQLAFHVIRDAGVAPSLHAMARFAAESYEESPGALSPSVFWWYKGTFTQVARQDDAGLHIQLTEDAMELAARFVGA